MNKQRQAVYGMRRALLEGQDQKERVIEMTEGIVGSFIDMRCPEDEHPESLGPDAAQDRHADPVRRQGRTPGPRRHDTR